MPEVKVTTKFYEFDQNNSGGDFEIDPEKGIGPYLFIEATNADHANTIAESIGIYFDGVELGRDCPCCGDRWSPAHYLDGEETVECHEYSFTFHPEVYVHRLDGKIETISKSQLEAEG